MHPSELALNDYVEGTLSGDARAELERHLEGCEACRSLVSDFRAIRQASASMPPLAPPPSAWKRIEESIRREGPTAAPAPRARRSLTTSQLGWLGIAATVLLATVLGLRMGLWTRSSVEAPTTATSATATATADIESVESEMRQAEEHYTKAISGLEQIATEGQGELDPETAATLQKSLAVVDQAIDESRAAVRSEPTSESAQQSLLENFSTKISLLQDTVALINEMRKGNDAGAAQIVSGLK